MKIQGSVRSNLISAITSARRWRGQQVHRDTIAYWHAILDCGRRRNDGPHGGSVGLLISELERELAQEKAARA